MFDRFLNQANELLAQGKPFAVAVVVRYQAPISGKPGDRAIIHADGKIWGWIGGGCAQPVVVQEALRALEDGRARLVRINPEVVPGPRPPEMQGGIVDYAMTCHSGGSMDIFIEPVLPLPHLVILGRSPIAQTLARLGRAVNYAVSVAAPGADRESFPDASRLRDDLDLGQFGIAPQTYIVVSTQGECDEEALEQALQTGASYIAFVASKAKAQKIFAGLEEKGIAPERLQQVRSPAGLDIHAASPEEIAVAILAEIIQVKGAATKPFAAAKSHTALPVLNQPAPVLKQPAQDPVCGMPVEKSGAKHKTEYRGSLFYFCCAGCQQTFDREPERYASSAP